MSLLISNLPAAVTSLTGAGLQPVVFHVPGENRRELKRVLCLDQPAAYLALFRLGPQGAMGCYVGSTGCGQDRPSVGAHLCNPHLADHIFVVTDAGGALGIRDARVLERFFYAKADEVTAWTMLCELPHGAPVGQCRYDELQLFGAQALLSLKHADLLFTDISARRLVASPRRHGSILPNLCDGPPEGERVVMRKVGIVAHGIDMGDKGFVIRAGSELRLEVVDSVSDSMAAEREQLFHNGDLVMGDGRLLVRRDIWRPSRTHAARFAAGTSATSKDWMPVSSGPHGAALRLVKR